MEIESRILLMAVGGRLVLLGPSKNTEIEFRLNRVSAFMAVLVNVTGRPHLAPCCAIVLHPHLSFSSFTFICRLCLSQFEVAHCLRPPFLIQRNQLSFEKHVFTCPSPTSIMAAEGTEIQSAPTVPGTWKASDTLRILVLPLRRQFHPKPAPFACDPVSLMTIQGGGVRR